VETKPFSIQSPEAIAKDYGGNKQKIAQAMQMGIIDPTAGTLAGMFIDRMRAAAQQEQAPQQTVAQQVMAPQPPPAPPAPPAGPPAGLGATPQAAQMGPPPEMGQPSAPPPGMAEGGMVPSYMGGGIADLPVPNDMFNSAAGDSDSQQYAGGGIVAFARGANGDQQDDDTEETTVTAAPKAPLMATTYAVPNVISNYAADPSKNLAAIQALAPLQTKQADRATKAYEAELTPESLKKAKRDDMWMALGQIGATMATTPGSFLQAAGAGIGSALPGIRAAASERKADERLMLKNLQEQEGLSNKDAKEARTLAMEMQSKYASLADALQDRAFKDKWENMSDDAKRYIAKLETAATIQGHQIGAGATVTAAGLGLDREYQQQRTSILKMVTEAAGIGGPLHKDYQVAVKLGGPAAGNKFINDNVDALTGKGMGTTPAVPSVPSIPPPPAGAVRVRKAGS